MVHDFVLDVALPLSASLHEGLLDFPVLLVHLHFMLFLKFYKERNRPRLHQSLRLWLCLDIRDDGFKPGQWCHLRKSTLVLFTRVTTFLSNESFLLSDRGFWGEKLGGKTLGFVPVYKHFLQDVFVLIRSPKFRHPCHNRVFNSSAFNLGQ